MSLFAMLVLSICLQHAQVISQNTVPRWLFKAIRVPDFMKSLQLSGRGVVVGIVIVDVALEKP